MRFLSLVLVLSLPLLAAEKRLNFVFLLVDDVGWGDFGCYGSKFHETPHIDALASQGILFTNAYAACTVCSPSRAAILTGRYPARLHLTDWIAGHKFPHAKLKVPNWKMHLEHKRTLLPEALKNAGYSTAFFGKWHLMPEGSMDFEKHYPDHHGFDTNIGGREWGQPRGRGRYFPPFDMPNLKDGKPGDFLTDKLTDSALDYLDKNARKSPFLAYLSYYTLHGPIMAPEKLVEKYQNKAKNFPNSQQELLNPARAGMVESLDNSIGRIMAKLEELGLEDQTVIILTGDNGGNFPENSGGLKLCKGYSHEGGIREPLIIKWPGHTKPGSRNDTPVIGTDFYPTILDIAGLPLIPDEHRDGVSLVPLLNGSSQSLSREALFWHYPHYHRTKPYGAIREGAWKLIEFFEDDSLELYNLQNDPRETKNLADIHPKTAGRLLKRLKNWRSSVGAQMMTPNPHFDPNKANKKKRPARAGQKKRASKAGS